MVSGHWLILEYTNRHINMGIGYTHSLNVAIMHKLYRASYSTRPG